MTTADAGLCQRLANVPGADDRDFHVLLPLALELPELMDENNC
jgi:hypothetical protein